MITTSSLPTILHPSILSIYHISNVISHRVDRAVELSRRGLEGRGLEHDPAADGLEPLGHVVQRDGGAVQRDGHLLEEGEALGLDVQVGVLAPGG